MVFSVTARQSSPNAGTSTGNLVTASATPTASSLYLVCVGAQMDAFGTETLPVFATPTGGSLTYTLVNSHGDVTPGFLWGSTNGFWTGGAVFRAPISGSPSAFAVTVDGAGGANTAYHSAVCLDVTGHNAASPIVQTARNGARINPESSSTAGSVTLGSAAASGNLIVVAFMCGTDTAGAVASPTAGVGKTFTTVTAQSPAFCTTGVFYRVADGTESTTITTADLGQLVGNYVAIAFEVALASSGSSFTETPTDNEGLTDTSAVDESKGATDPEDLSDTLVFDQVKTSGPDSVNLTEIVAVDELKAVSDNLGLTDSTAIEKVLAVAAVDNLGVTDTTLLAAVLERSVVDTEGLTDSAVVDEAKTAADNLGLTDTMSMVLDFAAASTDTEGLTDSTQVALSGAGTVSPSDNLGLTDTATMDRSQVAADSENLTDAAAVDEAKVFADTEGLTDISALSREFSISDVLGLSDTVLLGGDRNLSFIEAMGLADSISTAGSGALNVTDQLGVTDTTQVVADHTQGPVETLGLSDQVAISGTFAPVDTLTTLTELVDAVWTGSRGFVDALGLEDQVQVFAFGPKTVTINVSGREGVTTVSGREDGTA